MEQNEKTQQESKGDSEIDISNLSQNSQKIRMRDQMIKLEEFEILQLEKLESHRVSEMETFNRKFQLLEYNSLINQEDLLEMITQGQMNFRIMVFLVNFLILLDQSRKLDGKGVFFIMQNQDKLPPQEQQIIDNIMKTQAEKLEKFAAQKKNKENPNNQQSSGAAEKQPSLNSPITFQVKNHSNFQFFNYLYVCKLTQESGTWSMVLLQLPTQTGFLIELTSIQDSSIPISVQIAETEKLFIQASQKTIDFQPYQINSLLFALPPESDGGLFLIFMLYQFFNGAEIERIKYSKTQTGDFGHQMVWMIYKLAYPHYQIISYKPAYRLYKVQERQQRESKIYVNFNNKNFMISNPELDQKNLLDANEEEVSLYDEYYLFYEDNYIKNRTGVFYSRANYVYQFVKDHFEELYKFERELVDETKMYVKANQLKFDYGFVIESMTRYNESQNQSSVLLLKKIGQKVLSSRSSLTEFEWFQMLILNQFQIDLAQERNNVLFSDHEFEQYLELSRSLKQNVVVGTPSQQGGDNLHQVLAQEYRKIEMGNLEEKQQMVTKLFEDNKDVNALYFQLKTNQNEDIFFYILSKELYALSQTLKERTLLLHSLQVQLLSYYCQERLFKKIHGHLQAIYSDIEDTYNTIWTKSGNKAVENEMKKYIETLEKMEKEISTPFLKNPNPQFDFDKNTYHEPISSHRTLTNANMIPNEVLGNSQDFNQLIELTYPKLPNSKIIIQPTQSEGQQNLKRNHSELSDLSIRQLNEILVTPEVVKNFQLQQIITVDLINYLLKMHQQSLNSQIIDFNQSIGNNFPHMIIILTVQTLSSVGEDFNPESLNEVVQKELSQNINYEKFQFQSQSFHIKDYSMSKIIIPFLYESQEKFILGTIDFDSKTIYVNFWNAHQQKGAYVIYKSLRTFVRNYCQPSTQQISIDAALSPRSQTEEESWKLVIHREIQYLPPFYNIVQIIDFIFSIQIEDGVVQKNSQIFQLPPPFVTPGQLVSMCDKIYYRLNLKQYSLI